MSFGSVCQVGVFGLSLSLFAMFAKAQNSEASSVRSAAPQVTTVLNAVNLNPHAEAPSEERGIELREGLSGTRTIYTAKYRGTDGRGVSVIIPEASYREMLKGMSTWFKTIDMASTPRRLISCRDKIAMIQNSKLQPLCLDGLDDKQRPLFQNWYADVRNQIRANEW